jgi:hypothetical protein
VSKTQIHAQFGVVAALVLLGSSASYATALFTQALPTANLNGTSSSRSNVAVIGNTPPNPNDSSNPDQAIVGDAFTLSSSSNVSSITIYEVGNIADGSGPQDTPSAEFSNVTLYLDPIANDTGDLTDSFSLSGGALDSSSAAVQYVGSMDYQSVSGGAFYPIWAITFSVNLNLVAGQYLYAVGATPIGGNTFALLNSDSNPAINGGVESDESGGYGLFQSDGTPGNPPINTYGFATPPGYNNTDPVDVNVLVSGTAIPEPGTFALFGLGLAGVLAARRRRA